MFRNLISSRRRGYLADGTTSQKCAEYRTNIMKGLLGPRKLSLLPRIFHDALPLIQEILDYGLPSKQQAPKAS